MRSFLLQDLNSTLWCFSKCYTIVDSFNTWPSNLHLNFLPEYNVILLSVSFILSSMNIGNINKSCVVSSSELLSSSSSYSSSSSSFQSSSSSTSSSVSHSSSSSFFGAFCWVYLKTNEDGILNLCFPLAPLPTPVNILKKASPIIIFNIDSKSY